MHLNPAIIRTRIITQPLSRGAARQASTGSPQADAEIRAYIAARDIALSMAEQSRSNLTLNRAFIANEAVRNCLKPTRSPYQAQALSETEARSERERCEKANARLAQLRAEQAHAFFPCAVAA